MLGKRKFPRLNEEWELNYRVMDKNEFANDPMRQYTVNISGGGICFKANEEIADNTMLAIELESDQFPAPILALARAVRCKRARHGYEVGCEFWWVGWQNNDAQQAMADYISTAAKGPDSAIRLS